MAEWGQADLTEITDGQVPVYSSAVGKLLPGLPDIIFDFTAGPVATATSSGYVPSKTMTIVGLSLHLDTAGSTTTTVQLLKNGSNVGTAVSCTSGVTDHAVTFAGVSFVGGADEYALQITAAGTGAKNLTGTIQRQ